MVKLRHLWRKPFSFVNVPNNQSHMVSRAESNYENVFRCRVDIYCLQLGDDCSIFATDVAVSYRCRLWGTIDGDTTTCVVSPYPTDVPQKSCISGAFYSTNTALSEKHYLQCSTLSQSSQIHATQYSEFNRALTRLHCSPLWYSRVYNQLKFYTDFAVCTL